MAAAEPRTLRSAVRTVLNDFVETKLEDFKFYLLEPALFGEFGVISRYKLDTGERSLIVRAMFDHYGIFTIDTMKIVLREMDQNRLVQELDQMCTYNAEEVLTRVLKNMKSDVIKKIRFVFEGSGTSSRSRVKIELTEVYVEIFITKGRSEEHEVSQMERDSRRSDQETIVCQDIFRDTQGQEPIRVVLTTGVAGVGKTVLTQKFSLDWAEGRINQEIHLLFLLTFRELNMVKGSSSLVEFLHKRFKKTKELFSFQQLKLLFILDGLDECRHPLDFRKTRVLTDPNECASVEELLVNLIRGDLCPTARVWITTRPAAANQIPEQLVDLVTEVRGFTDEQKDKYFMKKFKNKAKVVLKHIKKCRSLYILCHIPVFCWILSDVLQQLMPTETAELPSTLTLMYIHFLKLQVKVQNQKYEGKQGSDDPWTKENKERVWCLAALAFEQLMKGNLIFYKEDLSQCGLDAGDIDRYSVFKEVLKTEDGEGDIKVYCFIHLSFHEFLAALYVHHIFFSTGENLLSSHPSSEGLGSSTAALITSLFQMFWIKDSPESFYRCAVDQALQSPNGRLDLFVRFLLGLSLPTNQERLRGLLTITGSDSINQKTVKHLKQKLNEDGISSEKKLNLLHCLNEMNDQSLLEETQKVLREEKLSDKHMSPADWSAMSFILLSSDSDLKEFDLRNYRASEEALLGLLPVLKVSTKATLTFCNLTAMICAPLASAISSSASLKHLDLSNNDLQDSGLELLCEGLKSATCCLETLRLSGCMISERGVASLAAALCSASSGLRELDLSYNHPGAAAEQLQEPRGHLQTLRFDPAASKFLIPGLKKYGCEFSLDPNTAHCQLLLSEDRRSVQFVYEEQYPHHEDRFTGSTQVLGSSGLRGRCYWEVDWRVQQGQVAIAMTSRGISRAGQEHDCMFGHNDRSWALWISGSGECTVGHNGKFKNVPGTVGVSWFSGRRRGRVGVFLDWEGGALSFYEIIINGRSLLHTFNICFTEELLPGFRLWWKGTSVSVVKLN